jgi:antitoxin HicB
MREHPVNKFEVRPLPDEDGGGWLVTFPDLPGCMADGETVEEALSEAADAERSWLETRRELGLPEPSGRFMLRLPKTLHAKLSIRAKQEGVSMNTLAVAYLSQGVGGKESDGGGAGFRG